MTTIAQQTLLLFDTRGETAALRHILDQPQFHSRRQERERRFILNDGSSVSRNPETGDYTFSWPEGREQRQERRQENPAVIFTYPSAHTVLWTMLLDIETRATPHGYEPPSRGDDPLITIKEAEAICPRATRATQGGAGPVRPAGPTVGRPGQPGADHGAASGRQY